MCGIVGIWFLQGDGIGDEVLNHFVDSVAHRGPDGRGIYRDQDAGLSLGHRRLAVLDLSPTGHQPMSYAGGRYWITYNGEVYNFLELREELTDLGHIFVTESDTEVILAAYAQWGRDCQLRFNGMWAFAIWDSQERTLFLSRDRFGIKPLHYVANGRYFAFASEMKAFLALPFYDYGFDDDVLSEVLGNINGLEGTEHCLLRGVNRLVGGHCLTIRQGRAPEVRQWWNTLDHLISVPTRFEDQAEQFRELFFDACRLRMRSDVPLATSLSGGLDSSSVLCTIHVIGQAQRFTSDWQKAFVACFPDSDLDEQRYARQVIEAKSAIPIYTEISVDKRLAEVEKMVYQFEDIYWVLLAGLMQNYKAMRANRVLVSLDGHGADELLGGYHFIVEEALRNALLPFPRLARYLDLRVTLDRFRGGSNPIHSSLRSDLQLLLSNHIQRVKDSWLLRPVKQVYRQFRRISIQQDPFVTKQTRRQLKYYPQLLERPELHGLTLMNRSLFTHFHDTTLPVILRNFDRASMANGIEVRMPFMDWRLVCFAFSLPDASKVGGGYAKRIVREAMRGIIPDPIRLRTNKVGFTSPMVQWFQGPLRSYLLDTVNSQEFLNSDLWSGPAIRALIEKCVEQGDWSSAESIWPYLNVYILLAQFGQQRTEYQAAGVS